jgi:hypothetical protein
MRQYVDEWISIRQVADVPERDKLLAFGLWLENQLFEAAGDEARTVEYFVEDGGTWRKYALREAMNKEQT